MSGELFLHLIEANISRRIELKAKQPIHLLCLTLLLASLFGGCGPSGRESGPDRSDLKFAITFPKEITQAVSEFNLKVPITGRVFVIITDNDEKEPRLQTGFDPAWGIPIYGKNVENLKPGEKAIIDDDVFGFPYENLHDLPPGEYFIQGIISLYTEFKRADGHTLWLHNDQWEGQKWNISPGNIYSDVKKVRIDPRKAQTFELECGHVIPPIEVPPDTKYVKRIKFQSEILSTFWGQPMYLGATILLPEGYDDHPDVYYPVNYGQGHFSLRNPFGFREEPPGEDDTRGRQKSGYDFYKYWTSEDCPRMLAVTFQHPCPYYDDSYAVNSPNTGPYGDAIMQELIPRLEERFRIIRKPYARVLSGGSTGGWISFALQVLHPDFFGGTWSLCPDPLDFRYYELINIYEDENAYYREYNKIKAERPEARGTDGQVRYTVRDTYYYEWTLGDKHRGGRQWAIWEAVYTPIGKDGYPQPLWNWYTGEIDHDVAEAWKKYDMRHYLETNWSWLGPKLVGKLHVYTGDMDTYYLDNAVVLLEDFLESTTDPYYEGVIAYGDRKPHCWGPRGQEILRLFSEHITAHAPSGENPEKWKY